MRTGQTSTRGFWQRLTLRERMLAQLTVLTAASALIYLVPFSMQERTTRTLDASVRTAEKEVVVLTKQIEEMKQRKSEAKQVSPGWELADQKSLILFLEDMSGAARTVGVNLVSVHPTKEIEKQTHKEVAMNLDLKGRYRELGEYFRKLESLSKLVNIRRVRLEACPDSATVCAAHIEAVTYMAK